MKPETNKSCLQFKIKLSTDNGTTVLALSKYKFLKSTTPVTKRTKYSLAQFERGVNLQVSLEQLMEGNQYATEMLMQPAKLEAFLMVVGLPQNAFDELELHHFCQLDREVRKLLYHQRIAPFKFCLTHTMDRSARVKTKQPTTVISPQKKRHGSK